MVTRENMISASAASEVALQHAESFNYADIEPEVNGDLSYVPVGDNVYQLCYEITTTDGIVFISVLDGAIIEPRFNASRLYSDGGFAVRIQTLIVEQLSLLTRANK